MAARFDFPIEAATAAAIREMAPEINVVSADASPTSCARCSSIRNRAWAMRQLDELGLLRQVLPEIDADMKGLPQGPPGAPTGDLWHTCSSRCSNCRGAELAGASPGFVPAGVCGDVARRRQESLGGTRGRSIHVPRTTNKSADDWPARHVGDSNSRMRKRLVSSGWSRRHQYLCDAPTMRAEQAEADPGASGHRRTARARTGPIRSPAAGRSSTSSSARGCCGRRRRRN